MSRLSRGLKVCVVVAGAVLAGVSVPARAQVAPDTKPAAPSNNWWEAPAGAPRPAVVPDTHLPPLFRHDTQGATVPTDYPRMEMQDWVVASAMSARARAMMLRAEGDLDSTIRSLQRSFEHSDMYTKAVAAEKQAYADYTAARNKAVSSLNGDPKYHAVSQLRDELGEKIATRRAARNRAADIDVWLHARGFDRTKMNGEQMRTLKAVFDAEQERNTDAEATRDDILAMATLKMQYAADARAMEVSLLSNDDAVKDAKAKLVEASKKCTDLRQRFDDTLHDHPDVLMARRNVEDARVQMIEMAQLAYGASMSSGYALNYSYYLHRNDNGGVYGVYGAGNGGYYSPFWAR